MNLKTIKNTIACLPPMSNPAAHQQMVSAVLLEAGVKKKLLTFSRWLNNEMRHRTLSMEDLKLALQVAPLLTPPPVGETADPAPGAE